LPFDRRAHRVGDDTRVQRSAGRRGRRRAQRPRYVYLLERDLASSDTTNEVQRLDPTQLEYFATPSGIHGPTGRRERPRAPPAPRGDPACGPPTLTGWDAGR